MKYMQVFAFTDNPEFQALLEVEVKDITGHRPIVRNTIDELKSLLSIFESIPILVIDFPENLSAVVEIKEFLLRSKDNIKNIFILGNDVENGESIRVFSRIDIAEMFESIKSHFSPKELPVYSWTAIPLCTLIHFESLPFDLYIKLSDQKYVKRIPAYEKVDNAIIESFKAKNIDSLYCEKKYNRDFSMMLINNMINKVDRSYPTVESELRANEEVFETTKQIIQNLGLSGRVIEVCEASIEKMCLDVLNDPGEFSAYLLSLKKNKNLDFQYKLITLTNYIGTQLIQDMNLPNQPDQVMKLVFASFFCDMTLSNPGLLYHRKAIDSEALSLHEQNEVNFHALKASELVANYKNTPKEVSLIIRQHHGSFSGIGFPDEKSNQLLPLSKVLVVSQELAYSILSEDDTPAMEVLRKFLKRNRCSGLQELLNCLEGTITKIA
jgi:hypothetical protein